MATNIAQIRVARIGRGGARTDYLGAKLAGSLDFQVPAAGSIVNNMDNNMGAFIMLAVAQLFSPSSTDGSNIFLKAGFRSWNIGQSFIRVVRRNSANTADDTTKQQIFRGIYFGEEDEDVEYFNFFRYIRFFNTSNPIDLLTSSDVGNLVHFSFYLATSASDTTSTTPLNLFADIAAPEPDPHNTASDAWDLVKVGRVAYQQIRRGRDLYWQQAAAPSITSFSSSLSTIDLDTRPSGNITLTFAVTGSTRNVVSNKETGMVLPNTTSTTVVIPQPQKTTTYVLTSYSSTGTAVSREVTVTVTKNAAISNLRRTGVVIGPFSGGSPLYVFEGTVEGLPRPTLMYRFSTGEQGVIDSRHFSQGANPYTWSVRHSITLSDTSARSLTWTATNASNTATATIANITA